MLFCTWLTSEPCRTYPRIFLRDTNHDDDWSIINNDGSFGVYNDTDTSYALTIDGSNNATFAGDLTVNGSDGIKVQSGNQGNAIRLVTNNDGTQIADDVFSGNTAKSYIYFDARSSSNDPGYIMHETSANSSS